MPTEANEPSVLQTAYELIDQTKEQLSEILSEPRYSNFKNGIVASLTQLSNNLRSRDKAPLKLTDRRRFQPIAPAVPEDEDSIRTPAQQEGTELEQDVNAIYDTFADRDTSEIMDSLNEMQIRGVAILAGLNVTETNPERITTAFVQEIQDAIRKQKEVNTLTTDPQGAARGEIETAKALLETLSGDRTNLEHALSKARSEEKKKDYSEKLEALTAQEADLHERINTLTASLADADNDQQ